jgi:hypothetical protein
LDSEACDPAEVAQEVMNYILTIEGLFCGDHPRCLEVFGYTKCMLDTLRRPLVWHIGTKTYSLGSCSGVSTDIINRCLDRMRCWVALMKATCAAEFPSFEVIQASFCVVANVLPSPRLMF